MDKKRLHILLIAVLFCLTGCFSGLDPVQAPDGVSLQLTIQSDDSPQTKIEMPGVDRFNENRIKSVEFLFYPGENPDRNVNAVQRVRQVLEGTVQREETFHLTFKKNVVEQIFKEENGKRMATVYVLVNFDESFIRDTLEGNTSLKALAEARVWTDFAAAEADYVQPSFLMDGKAVIEYKENENPSVSQTIAVTRFASKITMSVHVADTVVLKHREKTNPVTGEDETEKDEVWTPVFHTMRVFLVDGVKTVKLSRDGVTLPDPAAEDVLDPDAGYPEYFTYKKHMRPYVQNDNVTPYVDLIEKDGKKYYDCYPMYSYPREWSNAQWNYSNIDFTSGLPTEPPYLKLEMDWRRDTINGYAYDLRKYYYKVYLPILENKFVRNKWYGFLLDVGILGSETEEGKADLMPSCYILDWQNKSESAFKTAVISAARYLSVDKEWTLHNIETLSIPFMSSHNVRIIESSVTATRPYYGESKTQGYNRDLNAWVTYDSKSKKYYLDYRQRPVQEKWLQVYPNSIEFSHALDNDFEYSKGFDYSPYTIEFDIVHDGLGEGDPKFEEYRRHVKITQYPAIYIEAILNSDTDIIPAKQNAIGYTASYPDGTRPWFDKPWGYVYVNGRDQVYSGSWTYPNPAKYKVNTRLIRWDKAKRENSIDPVFQMKPANQLEYQWQTVWYTKDSRDLYNINVTVLPSGSNFVIGDPRTAEVDNLGFDLDNPDPVRYAKYHGLYDFENNPEEYQSEMDAILPSRTGFAEAASLDDETHPWRRLKWYYPTDNSPRTQNMLAPSYRIASKFGGIEYGGSSFIGDIKLPYAEYRCAAYQEDGFPAGRWRLPTKAEILFISQLSANGAFEKLFTPNQKYWSAHGAVKVGTGTVTEVGDSQALLRCVYDSWYWDSYDDRLEEGHRNQFVWGDKLR